jgi:hypothetical protein
VEEREAFPEKQEPTRGPLLWIRKGSHTTLDFC